MKVKIKKIGRKNSFQSYNTNFHFHFSPCSSSLLDLFKIMLFHSSISFHHKKTFLNFLHHWSSYCQSKNSLHNKILDVIQKSVNKFFDFKSSKSFLISYHIPTPTHENSKLRKIYLVFQTNFVNFVNFVNEIWIYVGFYFYVFICSNDSNVRTRTFLLGGQNKTKQNENGKCLTKLKKFLVMRKF